jgi:cytochrome c oxidase subunit 2
LAIYSGFTMKAVGADAPEELQINVIGHQWWWEYQYPRYGIDTASELHLPTGTPVRLNITADDVIHSFWVPDLGWKQDAIPGKTNTMELDLTKTGTWDGQCAEFCGAQHAWMRIRVITQSPVQFNQWVSAQRTPPPAPTTAIARQGQRIFMSNTCVNCHLTSRVGPSLTHFGSREWIGSGVLENTPRNLALWINHVQDVKQGALMPDFHFSESDLSALVAYLEGQK